MMAVIIAIIAIVFPAGAHSSSVEGFLMRAVSLSGFSASHRTRSSGPVIPWVFIARPLKSKPKAAPLRSLPIVRYFPPAVAPAVSLVVAEKSGYTPPIRFVLIVTYTGSSYSLQTSWMAYRSL